MPRPLRDLKCRRAYHVYQRGNERQRVFHSQRQLLSYLNRLNLLARRYKVRIHAFCLMSNHVHFILEPTRKRGISNLMRDLQSQHAREVLLARQSDGHLWKHHYGALALGPAHYRAALRYVEENPVRAGVARRPEDYPYSSAAAHCAHAAQAQIHLRKGSAHVDLYLKRWQAELAQPAPPLDPAVLAQLTKVLGPDRRQPLPSFPLPRPIPPPCSPSPTPPTANARGA